MSQSMNPAQLAYAFGAGKRRAWPVLWIGCIAFLSIAALAAIAGSGFRFGLHAAKPVIPYPHELAHVSFAIAGDVIPHEAVRAAAAAAGNDVEGWTALLSDVSDVFQSADFGFVNMETPVAPAHSKGSKPFMFDAPVALP